MDATRKLRVSGRRVLNLVEFAWKAAEVVNRARSKAWRVTSVAGRYQWAEIPEHGMGRGIFFPDSSSHLSVQVLRARAFIGLPCPKKMAGMDFRHVHTNSLFNDEWPQALGYTYSAINTVQTALATDRSVCQQRGEAFSKVGDRTWTRSVQGAVATWSTMGVKNR